MVASAIVLGLVEEGGYPAVEVSNLVQAHQVPASRHRTAVIALIGPDGGKVLWERPVIVSPDSTSTFVVDSPDTGRATAIEVRFYPSRTIWPEKFFVLESFKLP
jgi:hypothetical protein